MSNVFLHFYVISTTFGCLSAILFVVITRVTLGLGKKTT